MEPFEPVPPSLLSPDDYTRTVPHCAAYSTVSTYIFNHFVFHNSNSTISGTFVYLLLFYQKLYYIYLPILYAHFIHFFPTINEWFLCCFFFCFFKAVYYYIYMFHFFILKCLSIFVVLYYSTTHLTLTKNEFT